MNPEPGQSSPPPDARGFPATVWPRVRPKDSEIQRRKKFAVRGGHLAMVVMIGAAVAGPMVSDFQRLSALHLAALAAAGLCYIAWSLYGTGGAVGLLLWERGAPPPRSSRLPRCGALPYFAVHLGLAALVYHLAERGRQPSLAWLALLPPVAYAVFLLERPGIAVVSLLTAGAFVLNMARWHGWAAVPYSLLAFSFAMVFTLVFALLAVSSETARDQVQRLAEELGEANRKLREYATQVEELAAARERNRLAREIHDTLGHYLAVVNVQIEAARALQESDPARARAALEKAQSLTQEGLQEIRRSVASLRASPLDNQPLAEVLRRVVEESRAAGLNVEFEVLGPPRALSPQAALTFYRAGQEGLTNARKHARAAHVRLALDFQDARLVRLQVSDDGAGAAEPAGAGPGFGLLGLRERAQLLGGALRVSTAPGAGFTLELEAPA